MGGNVGKKLKEGVTSLDSFPQSFVLTYNKDNQYKTLLGGICSIIVFVIIALLFTVLTIRLVSKSNISVNYNQTPFSNGGTNKEEHDLKADGRQIGFILAGMDKNINHRRIFDVYFQTNERYFNETSGEYETSHYRYFTEKCSNDTFHEYSIDEDEIAHSY